MAAERAHPRILLFGASGQIGRSLLRTLTPLGDIVAPDHDQIDLADTNALAAAIREIEPALIVNAAAYTDVDGAESDEARAAAVNAAAPKAMAEAAARIEAPFVHYSTDYVFDGRTEAPYREDDETGPLNAYGRTKLAGEQAVAETGAAHFIFRTSWIYSPGGKNFLLTIRRLAHERDELAVVADQIGSPTPAWLVAEATSLVLARCWRPGSANPLSGMSGLYHLTASGQTSWHGFAEAIVESVRRSGDPELRARAVKPIATAQFPRPAKRPAHSTLDCGKIEKTFGLALPGWRRALALTLDAPAVSK